MDNRELHVTLKQVWIDGEFVGWDGSVQFDGEEVMSVVSDSAWDAMSDMTYYLSQPDATVSREWMNTVTQ